MILLIFDRLEQNRETGNNHLLSPPACPFQSAISVQNRHIFVYQNDARMEFTQFWIVQQDTGKSGKPPCAGFNRVLRSSPAHGGSV